ncbi:MAG: NAD(P)/FAD-dependent oxidoreductase [Nannocystaceae bacterium]
MLDTTGSVIVIGAGPAGLTAAYELIRRGQRPLVIEKLAIVGGIARTESYRGFCFDMGGHRFFTKSEEVKQIWQEILADDFLLRPRLSRIYYEGRFFRYPLEPWDALRGLGLRAAALNVLSYLKWRVFPHRQETTFEQWVTNRFGRRLFETFFKAYTEKVWGVSCSELSSDWAAQRIKDLSLGTALIHMFLPPRRAIKSLIQEFHYPRRGPGMMWEAMAARVVASGGEVRTDCDVRALQREGRRICSLTISSGPSTEQVAVGQLISSMPLTELVAKIDPPPPSHVQKAAAALRYRDFLTVCLIIDQPSLFPDNWLYIHDPEVMVGRIQNYKNWSPDMVGDSNKTALGLEYFCFEGDELWNTPDCDLIERGRRELEAIGLASPHDVSDGCVVRVPKAYPVYDATYRKHLRVIRGFVDGLTNLVTIGRNGLHRYNNQDHAMLTGIHAVRNMIDGESSDLWEINADTEYHEQSSQADPRQ